MSDSSRFGRTIGKFSIKSLEKGDNTVVTAQFNPKELQVDRQVPWTPTSDTNATNNSAADAAKKSGGIDMQFTGAKGRSLTVELLFDGVEAADATLKVDVGAEIGKLEHLATIKNPKEKKEEERRPHHCIAVWGSTLQGFRCVIESISTKYTMFNREGNPLRATCTLKLLEADSVSGQKKPAAAPAGGGGAAPAGGGTGGGTAPAGGK